MTHKILAAFKDIEETKGYVSTRDVKTIQLKSGVAKTAFLGHAHSGQKVTYAV